MMSPSKIFNGLKYVMSLVYFALGVALFFDPDNKLGNRKMELIIASALCAYGLYRMALSWKDIRDKRKSASEETDR